MKTKWLQYFTPFLLVLYVCMFGILSTFIKVNDTKGWKITGIIVYLAIGILVFSVDLFCKEIFKTQLFKTILTESIIIGLTVFFVYMYF